MTKKRIAVGVVKTKHHGTQFKYRDRLGKTHWVTYQGKNTRNAIDDARRELEETLNRPGSARRWSDFEKRVHGSFLRGMTISGQGKPKTMLRRFREALAEFGDPDPECSELSEDMVLLVEERMESEGLAKMTIRTNMGALWAVLNWGAENKLIPRLHRPRKRVRKADRIAKSVSKGRALTVEEIERMVDALRKNPVIRPNAKLPGMRRVLNPSECPEPAIRAIHVARLMGMRLEDAHWFCWEPRDGCHYPVSLGGRSPMISYCEGQKSGRQELIPITPMAAEYLRSIEQEYGWVCRMTGKQGEHKTSGRLGRVVANAGRAAKIMVKADGGKFGTPKYASAHDLRRTFGLFLLDHVNLRDAQTMMRHASVDTLLRFYSDSSEDLLAMRLRELFSKSGGNLVDENGALFPETP